MGGTANAVTIEHSTKQSHLTASPHLHGGAGLGSKLFIHENKGERPKLPLQLPTLPPLLRTLVRHRGEGGEIIPCGNIPPFLVGIAFSRGGNSDGQPVIYEGRDATHEDEMIT